MNINLKLTIILLGAILLSGCINHTENDISEKKEYFLSVSISPDKNLNYSLFIPIPIYINKTISNIVKDLSIIEGHGNFSIIDTIKGNGLNITSTSNIVLDVRGKYCGDYLFDIFSLQNITYNENYSMGGEIEHWIYLFKDELIKKVDISIKCRSGGRYFEIETSLNENGWQIVNGILETVVP